MKTPLDKIDHHAGKRESIRRCWVLVTVRRSRPQSESLSGKPIEMAYLFHPQKLVRTAELFKIGMEVISAYKSRCQHLF
jgi:hypothetical protein